VSEAASVAVLDVGKTNVKLSAVTPGGEVAETVSVGNPVLPGPPWRHHDLRELNAWVLESLAARAAGNGEASRPRCLTIDEYCASKPGAT